MNKQYCPFQLFIKRLNEIKDFCCTQRVRNEKNTFLSPPHVSVSCYVGLDMDFLF